jgi:hypothetical protein
MKPGAIKRDEVSVALSVLNEFTAFSSGDIA